VAVLGVLSIKRILAMTRRPLTRLQLARYLLCPALYTALFLLVTEAFLSAATTYLVIKVGRDIANDEFLVRDLFYILATQSASYMMGASSWVFSERAGFRAFGLYMLRFAQDNRHEATLLREKVERERVEPFLTGETFYEIFNMMYEVESQLQLFLGVVFNALVLGVEIDKALPIAYGAVFVILSSMQWSLRNRVARAYLQNQRMTNRVTSQGYTAWDNVFTGNRYNLGLWFAEFKSRLRDCLRAQIKAIAWREGLSTGGGVIGLLVVFATMAVIAAQQKDDLELLIALAVTLPRQIEMTSAVHEFVSGWNDVLAHWTRWGGVIANMRPSPDPQFDTRIQFDRVVLREGQQIQECASVGDALRILLAQPTGRINLRGGNASGKSTLLESLKSRIKKHSYYWPTGDRLSFAFARQTLLAEAGYGSDEEDETEIKRHLDTRSGFSSGEHMLNALHEIVDRTDDAIYLFDEWDANLDAVNRVKADRLVDKLATRARVIEISHRDQDSHETL
jgi:hypothetical protein